ncbi:MAG: HAD family phosphatase [Oscillospiraceae bacterium]|nr:HAD family phosphatase [Oscillospiraceae bacterium]
MPTSSFEQQKLKNAMIKAVVFDLDGTIVSHDTGTYSAATASAFASLREKGIFLIAATGRSPYELQVTKMIDGLPLDAIVSLNGQYCYTEEEDLYVNPFPAALVKRILGMAALYGFPCAVIEKEGTFINFATPFVRQAQDDIHMPVPEFRDFSGINKNGVLMLTVFVPEKDEKAFIQSMDSVSITRWNTNAVDIVPASSGKVRGIDVVLQRLGIGWKEVFAFGDGDNDYDMLKKAGKGFAMKDSSIRLLNGEFEVADSVDKDGVVKMLRKYSII